MKKSRGLHFYINIANYNSVIEKEQEEEGQLKHSIHALDSFFTSIEQFSVKNNKSLVVNIEKITGSRLHIYITANEKESLELMLEIVSFVHQLKEVINKEVDKYNKLLPFTINVGACYGNFYDYIFVNNNIEEETTIGNACNLAAKIQSDIPEGYIAIDFDSYVYLPSYIKMIFKLKVSDRLILENERIKYYYASLFDVNKIVGIDNTTVIDSLKDSIKSINEHNLSDLSRIQIRSISAIRELKRNEYTSFVGIPFFSDIRGFTKQFNSDDSNLDEMSEKVRNILKTMYDLVNKHNGVHIQFQGDREFAVFYNDKGYEYIEEAIIAGLHLIDEVGKYSVSVGIGLSKGRMYVTKIGARGNKDTIVLGSVVNDSDYLEDKCAKEKQIAISKDVYDVLCTRNSILANLFIKKTDYYVTEKGYLFYEAKLMSNSDQKDYTEKNYNGAWLND